MSELVSECCSAPEQGESADIGVCTACFEHCDYVDLDDDNDDPMFVMSQYANKEELYKAKAQYYMEKSERLQEEVYANHRIRRQRRAYIAKLESKLRKLNALPWV